MELGFKFGASPKPFGPSHTFIQYFNVCIISFSVSFESCVYSQNMNH